MRRLLSMAVAIGASAAPAVAAGPPETGDLLVGDGTSLVLVDPQTGTRSPCGIATADVRDVAVDAQRRLLALTADGSIERFEPSAFGSDPSANREGVGALAGAQGIALDTDGTLLVADGDGDRVVRVDPDAFEPGDPTSNQTPVASGGLLDGPLDVAIDPQLDVAYSTTTTRVVAIDLAAAPGSNEQQVAANPFVWASLAVLPDGRIVAAGPFGLARIDPALFDPGAPFANLAVVGSGGELQQPTGIAVERSGAVVVPEPKARGSGVMRPPQRRSPCSSARDRSPTSPGSGTSNANGSRRGIAAGRIATSCWCRRGSASSWAASPAPAA